MMITSQTIALLKKHEGLRLKPYTDTVGKLTIGVGRNLTDRGITEAEADYLLMNDLAQAERDARALFGNFDAIGDARQAVLIDMAFNMGKTRLSGFKKFIAAVLSGDYTATAAEMLDSAWAFQVGNRSKELSKMMITGNW